jgi:hypothetical protein
MVVRVNTYNREVLLMKQRFSWEDFFNFEYMITPIIIKIFYFLSSVGVIIYTIYVAYQSFGEAIFFGIFIIGFIVLIIVRMFFEWLIIFYSLHDDMTCIKSNTEEHKLRKLITIANTIITENKNTTNTNANLPYCNRCGENLDINKKCPNKCDKQKLVNKTQQSSDKYCASCNSTYANNFGSCPYC